MHEPHLFTRDEANAMLPHLDPIVGELRRATAVARAALPDVEALARRATATGGTRPTAEEHVSRRALADAQEIIAEALETMGELGVLCKDVERGLVDFPSQIEGRAVELCWMHGERSVDHWHAIDEGFASRKRL